MFCSCVCQSYFQQMKTKRNHEFQLLHRNTYLTTILLLPIFKRIESIDRLSIDRSTSIGISLVSDEETFSTYFHGTKLTAEIQ